jgi:hypothetical protein
MRQHGACMRNVSKFTSRALKSLPNLLPIRASQCTDQRLFALFVIALLNLLNDVDMSGVFRHA